MGQPADYGRPSTYREPAGNGQPQGYGQPAGNGPGFDPKSVNPLDWVAMGAGFLALIFSFFAYYSYDPTASERRGPDCLDPSSLPAGAGGIASDLCSGGATASAWHGFFGWFGVLLGLVAAGLVAFAVFAPTGKVPAATRLIALGAAGLGLLWTLIALLVIPDWPKLKDFAASVGGSFSSSDYDKNIANGHGFSYWIVLIMLIAVTAATFQRYRQTSCSAASPDGGPESGSPGYGPPSGYGSPQNPPPGFPPAFGIPPGYGQAPAPPATAPQESWTPPPVSQSPPAQAGARQPWPPPASEALPAPPPGQG
jgi:hypothetical protein